MSDNEDNEGLNKKAIVVVLFPVLIVSLFLVLFFTIFADEPENNVEVPQVESNVEIAEDEQAEVEGLAASYIQEAGNFGVRESQITPENIDEMATLLEMDPNSATNYFTSRKIVYEGLDQFIYEGSPLHYASSAVEVWSDDFETVSRASFTVDPESIQATAPETGTYIQDGQENLRSVAVTVQFTTKEKMFVEQGSEIGVERSYSVMEKDFKNTARFIFVYEEHEEEENDEHSHGSHWKLYNIAGLENEFVLASWEDPNMNEFTETQFGFTETGKIVPSNQNIDPALPEEE